MKRICFSILFILVFSMGAGWWGWIIRLLPGGQVETGSISCLKPEPATVSLTAVGDVVLHMPIVTSAYDPAKDTYDFRPIFTELKASLSRADLAIGVLETTTAGPEAVYSGYPRFNSPAAISDALQWAGIDLVFTAHNHCLDRGSAGIRATLDHLERIGLLYAGCQRTPAQKRYRLLGVKGIKLAFLAYTTSTNGIALPVGDRWMVNYYQPVKAAADIEEARMAGAECVVVALHTGVEYQRLPSVEQIRLVAELINAGADVILGSHVHVIQPLELRESGGRLPGLYRDCFIAYSLGNLLSNQRWRYSDCGLMINLQIQKNFSGPGIRIKKVSYRPLWVNRYLEQGKYHYRIKEVTGPENNREDPYLNQAGRERIKEVWDETFELLSKWPSSPQR
ncbi:MAG: CapA family protein [Bacillota bacterium]